MYLFEFGLYNCFNFFFFILSVHESGARGVVDSDSDSDSDSDDDHIFMGVSKETAKAMKETQKLQTQMKEMGL